MQAHSLYLHIPFCKKRCAYCDFNTYAGLESMIPRYVEALCREMELVSATQAQRIPVHTVFFGGGTPSLLPLEKIEQILTTARHVFDVQPGAEITLEANPGTTSRETLHELRRLGVNRLSLGMQSANPHELQVLTRIHDFSDVIQSVTWARQAGFDNLSLDLIFALPGQSLESWNRTLELAVGLAPDHLSLYSLIVEEGTPMYRWSQKGLVDLPDDDRAADMYEAAMDRLERGGFAQYEISNWAQRGSDGAPRSCRHNLQYWRGLPYLGFGAGAHGFAGGWRTNNVRPVRVYVRRCLEGTSRPFPLSPANEDARQINRGEEMAEWMMVGLRLTEEGISAERFQRLFGKSLESEFGQKIERLSRAGLLEWAEEGGKCLRLTRRGRLLGNRVFMEFI